jgi:hypothetical protein
MINAPPSTCSSKIRNFITLPEYATTMKISSGLEINSSKTEEIRVNTIVKQRLRLNRQDIKRSISAIWVVLLPKMEVPARK